jgi:hypothetical protein
MLKRNRVIFKEGGVEAAYRLRELDDEFCRRLRAAIEKGSEFCPTTVSTEPRERHGRLAISLRFPLHPITTFTAVHS